MATRVWLRAQLPAAERAGRGSRRHTIPPVPDPNLNALWCRAIAEELVRAGVRRAVLCPGPASLWDRGHLMAGKIVFQPARQTFIEQDPHQGFASSCLSDSITPTACKRLTLGKSSRKWSRAAALKSVPVGLFGLARKTMRVSALMA